MNQTPITPPPTRIEPDEIDEHRAWELSKVSVICDALLTSRYEADDVLDRVVTGVAEDLNHLPSAQP